MANKKFIQTAIKKPGRTRRMLKLKKGQKVTQTALNKKIAAVKKHAPSAARKSKLGALNLAKRLIKTRSQKGGLRKATVK
jgi:hypothetical protein